MATLIADDKAPHDVGLSFPRHALFGEDFVKQHPGAYEKWFEHRRAIAEQTKEAEFQQKMAVEDDTYSNEN